MRKPITTRQLADALCVNPESIRTRLARHKHYYGEVPARGANGRLVWPAEALDRLIRSAENSETKVAA